MTVTIIVATHKKYRMPKEPCYLPLHVGKKGKADIGFVGDDTGDNISEKNPYYCELTGLYWLWKNVSSDYMGLVHYRRYFAGKRSFLKKDPFERIAGQSEIEKVLRKTDIIVPKKRHYYIESLYSHYAHTHYKEHLDITRNILVNNYPEYVEAFDRVMKRTSAHMFNMLIMSRERCNEYCEWVFSVLKELEKHIDIDAYNSYQARLYGRVSELLLDVWIWKNQYDYKEMPIVNIEKIQWKKKIKSFIMAKVSGKKYSGSF